MKVYVVTQGQYSDRHIIGIFDSKKKAEAFHAAFIDDEGWCGVNELIEEYHLNPYESVISNNLKRYFVVMGRDGHTYRTEVHYDSYPVVGGGRLASIVFWIDGWCVQHTPKFKFVATLKLYCWARDEGHAVKIANEKRIQIVANNRWGEEHFSNDRGWVQPERENESNT